MDLQFPPGVNPQAHDLINRMVVKDADARLGAHDISDIKNHPYFKEVQLQDLHLRPKPFPSLAEICLQKIGGAMKEYKEALNSWEGFAKLKPELRDILRRMELAQKWQDDVLPPEED